jgi:hypothetical protein
MRDISVIVLMVTAVLIAAVRADELASPQSSTPARDNPVVRDNPLAARSLDEFSATRERPLFIRGRRESVAPPVVHVEAPPPPPPAPPDLALFGTFVDGAGASAIVRGAPSEKIVHVRVGDNVDGWKIAKIDDRQLVLSLDDRSVTFTMFSGGHAEEHTASLSHMAPILELNAAGVLRAHRPSKLHP